MDKLDDFVSKRTNLVKQNDYRRLLLSRFDYVSTNYKKAETKKSSAKKTIKKKAEKEATAKETTVEGSNEASARNE